jgi:hypothetical protein
MIEPARTSCMDSLARLNRLTCSRIMALALMSADDPPVQDGAYCFGEVRLSHALAKRPAAGPGPTRPARREER